MSVRGLLVRRFRSYEAPALEVALRGLGLAEGQVVLMHGGWSPFSGFRGTPPALLDCVVRVLGDRGTLLMVSMAYAGSAHEYLTQGAPFDVRTTMSRMGLLTEVLRRRAGVRRSLNPVHPVLALGPRADWLVAGHDGTLFSCGEDTPFEKLARVGGKILLYDVPFLTATFLHHLEHRFQDRLPRVYHEEILEATVVDAEGVGHRMKTRVFDPRTARLRDQVWLDLQEEFRRRDALRSSRLGNTRLMLLDARELIQSADALLPRAGTPAGLRPAPPG
jgi:aminoglycoside 3-N-acetyltransferase